jgi:cytidylate kinase
MSEAPRGLRAIYIDGETKTGKGAAGLAIADALRADGLKVYYDIAGDFFRRYVAVVRQYLQLDEAAALPLGPVLEEAATKVYEWRKPFEKDLDLGDLQRQAISDSVAVLSKLPVVQQAGAEWYLRSAVAASEAGADVLVLDGRNPRQRVSEVTAVNGPQVPTVLDLYMTCTPEEAARRVLLTRGITAPTAEELKERTDAVIARRQEDRNRAEVPFTPPTASVLFDPVQASAAAAIAHSWQPLEPRHELPLTIVLDNTHLAKPDMLAAVAELARAALER